MSLHGQGLSRVAVELSWDDQLRLYAHLLGYHVTCGRKYKTPPELRGTDKIERTPSFSLYQCPGNKNVILFRDFGASGKGGDVYDLMREMKSKFPSVHTFSDAMHAARTILGTQSNFLKTFSENHKIIMLHKPKMLSTVKFDWVERPWHDYDLQFFAQFGITEAGLAAYKCKPASWFQYQKGNYQNKFLNSPKEPVYTFDMGDGYRRFYRPLSDRKQRFWSNVPAEVMFGMNCLPPEQQDVGILAAGQKDCMSGYCNSGLWHVSMSSESGLLTPQLYVMLKKKFRIIIPVYDNDLTGKNQKPNLVRLYNMPDVSLPQMPEPDRNKDIADYNRLLIRSGVAPEVRRHLYHQTLKISTWLSNLSRRQNISAMESLSSAPLP